MENTAPAQDSQQFKRRTVIIKRSLQFRYMAMILVSVIVGFLIVGLEFSWNLSRILNDRPALISPLMDELGAAMPLFLIKLAIYLTIVLLVSVVVSHQMAGPIYKFEKSAGIAASGDLTHRVFLRKGDQLTEMQEEFNKMLDALQGKVKEDRLAAEAAAAELTALADADAAHAAELKALAQKVSSITGGFRV